MVLVYAVVLFLWFFAGRLGKYEKFGRRLLTKVLRLVYSDLSALGVFPTDGKEFVKEVAFPNSTVADRQYAEQ